MNLEQLKQKLEELYLNDVTVNTILQHAITINMSTEHTLIWLVKELAKEKKHFGDELVKLHMNSTPQQ